ncbi:phosphoribosylaminoimidazolesuccinocarboxamide synthase [Gottfriedia acidiceleris]|uniref:phosphoribosylaminoimidazolesuccinocarboxamide synthase n=1 Tax=Gottfriedia acidiceleris TaxID=371036 RepID=UPI00101D92FE|nr:phosphoribosylaminoimidazolesuccinocarboxamide synthase [Gottfriedia acidiceleris]
MAEQVMLYEGKAKRIFSTENPEIVRVVYKDSATAFNGEKKAEIAGKGRLNNAITSLLFSKLMETGIATHFVEKTSELEQLVKRVTIVPIEVVVRNIVAGSLSKRMGLDEGVKLEKPIIEFYYKRDDLGDPIINEDHIAALELATTEDLVTIKEIALRVNDVLLEQFNECNVRLVDFKLEFGKLNDGTILLADEISPDTCRLWDKDTNAKFDKDVFRRDLGNLTDGYEEILKRLGGLSCSK